jgi:hypothetical protein
MYLDVSTLTEAQIEVDAHERRVALVPSPISKINRLEGAEVLIS